MCYLCFTDIDECLISNGGCKDICLNFPRGSYNCACKQGFVLKSDQKSCQGNF